VAYKEVTEKRGMTEKRMMREVNTIRARKHPNIVPFFAGFSAGRENPWDDEDPVICVHMLFEHTDAGNMHDWLALESPPELLVDAAKRHEYIIDCIQNLVSAVAFIHKDIDGFYAHHHDLKPKNILSFRGPAGPLPIWKICDFGMARLTHRGDASGTTHGPNDGFGTYEYQPPEYFSDEPNPKHGRAFDVFSLGCIILELVTVAIHGWSKAGIPEFTRLREANTQHACSPRYRKRNPDSSDSSDSSFHNSPNVVKDWISHLRENTAGDPKSKLLYLLDLILEMLDARNARIFIWEVDMDLYELQKVGGAMPSSKTLSKDLKNDLREHLRKVVQESESPLNELNNEHNPLKRAIQKKKHWQEDILRQNKWSVSKPEPNDQLRIKRSTTGIYYSTLKSCPHTDEFERVLLFGRHEMDDRITHGFTVSNCIGLYGLSGIG